MNEISIGCVVEFANILYNQKMHEEQPEFFPAPGTLGTVESINLYDLVLVRWNDKETSGDHIWYVSMWRLRLVE